MKKISSVLLCAVIIIPIMANLLTASSEPVSAHGWFCDQIFGAGSDFNITVNADGSYNLYTYQAGSFLTERAYDITKTDLSFKFTTSQANWYLLTVAAPTGDVGSTLAYEKTPTRVDFLIYGGKILCRQSTDDANGTVSQDIYGEIDFNDITHTFGIKQMDDGNWYPVIDGIVKTTISQKLNDFIDTNGTDLRLGIGVYNPEDPNNANKVLDIDIESVKTVPRIWEVKSDPRYVSDHALTTADGTSELILGSGHNSVFATIDSYDLTQKDIEFVLPNNVADSSFVIGLGTDFSNKGDLNYAIILRDGGSKSALMAGYAYNGWQDGAFYDSVFDIGASRNQTHTFGLRQKSDGYYYPAIDGKILELNISDPNAINLYNEAVSFVSSNKNALKFAIGDFGGPYIVKNVKIVDKNTNETLWTNVEPNNLTIHEDKPGVYSSKGTSRIYTTKKIDLASNDVFFKFDENVDYMYLAFSDSADTVNSSCIMVTDSKFNNCVEFTAHNENGKLGTHFAFTHSKADDSDWLKTGYASAEKPIDFSVPHSYGIRQYNGHWYLALDGVILNTGVTSERLDTLMTNGNNGFYITIGAWGSYYSAEEIEIVKQCEIGDANNDGSVNIVDLIRVKKLASESESICFVPLADLENDNLINTLDLTKLRQKLLTQ